MSRIISLHEYILKPEVTETKFQTTLKEARERGLLQLPGLKQFYFLKGVRGSRQGQYAALWIYESRESWEKLWGPVNHPIAKSEYPENWKCGRIRFWHPF